MNHTGITHNAREMTVNSNRLRANMIQANLGPGAVPDSAHIGLGPGDNPTLSTGRYRRLVSELGAPAGTRPADPDAGILSLVPTGLRTVPDDPLARCVPLPASIPLGGGSIVRLRVPTDPVEIDLRRFDRNWTRVGTIARGRTVELRLPAGPSPEPWIVRAPGACRVVPPPG